jgi:oxygen-independent coproporphyrinogen-3 oxidase
MTDQALPSESSLTATSLYVHIPWCVRKCPYCDFNSHLAGNAIDEQRYINALMCDLDAEAKIAGKREIKSIFFGGGTPSLFSPEAISKILGGITERFNLSESAEVTMEANPGTFEQKNFSEFRSAGVNRLSIGIQSFDDACLKNIGRIHDSQQSLSAISTALNAGFENINLDLMFGLPDQSIDLAMKDTQIACDQGVQHISHYQLTIEPNTYFHKHPPQTPNNELLWDMQHRCHEILSANNFSQYEVSAFSKEDNQCHHNLNYWTFGDYIGIGAGAHGKLTVNNKILRRWKHRQPEDYMKKASHPLSGQSTVEGDEVIFEFLLNALRLRHGFTFETFEKNTGLDRSQIIKACEKVDTELLKIDKAGIQTSEKGFQFLNDVLQQFI